MEGARIWKKSPPKAGLFSIYRPHRRCVHEKRPLHGRRVYEDGENPYHYLLYSKPTIISREYDELSQDSTLNIAAFMLLGISDPAGSANAVRELDVDVAWYEPVPGGVRDATPLR